MGVVGLGQRGAALIDTTFACENATVVAVCDQYEDRRRSIVDKIARNTGVAPVAYASFDEMLDDGNLDAVLIASSWNTHVEFAVKCMRKGIPTALEVGGAYDVESCWTLVQAYEETKTPFMLMENCCYDFFELLATTAYRKGLLGEAVYCHGAYRHDLREEILGGNVNRHYRLKEYQTRNCDNYPTHEIGPIAKLLNINRGNRLKTLVSVASKARGLEVFSMDERNPDKSLSGTGFQQGDIVQTMITCENGELISLRLDTTLPSYYSREFTVRGTKGMCQQDTNMICIDGQDDLHFTVIPSEFIEKELNNARRYAPLVPQIWQDITQSQRELGHGGMDYLMLQAFFTALEKGEEMPIDIYDAATWMCITALSSQSIAQGVAMEVPDFTKGSWKERPPKDVTVLKV